MFRTRNRYEQPTLKAQIYSKGMVVVRELMAGYQGKVTVLYHRYSLNELVIRAY